MRTTHRRLAALLSAAILVVLLAVALAPEPASAQQAVRKSFAALTPTELASFRRGVATMIARNTASRGSATYRTSWQYWANMHSHFGSDCRGPITGAGMSGVTTWKANSPTEASLWCKCEHKTDQFLTWHRMYLYYFERVLQTAAGDPTLRLPYWDYEADAKLPQAFRDQTYVNDKGQTVPNPLFVANRRAQLNSGASGLAATQVSTTNAMAQTTFHDFGTALEGTPHGTVHCGIGVSGCNTGYMGAVPSAALDPIFYVHHANIDRLYECWLGAGSGRLPTDPTILNRRYSFVDGDGTVRQRRVGDMLTTARLGYTYASGGAGCPPTAASGGTAERVAQNRATGTGTGTATASTAEAPGQELVRGLTEVPVPLPPPAGTATTAAARRTEVSAATVTIEGVTADKAPEVVYDVYLANAAGDRAWIGTIDFFGFEPGASAAGAHRHGGPTRDFRFDATAAARALGIGAADGATVAFEPSTGLDDSTVSTAAAAIAPDVRVRFARLRIAIER